LLDTIIEIKVLSSLMQFRTLGVNIVQKYILLAAIEVVLLLLLLSFFTEKSFYNISMAISPSFELQEITNENHHWVQTYGNSDKHLKSSYTDILAVDYISDGKTLNATIWLASGFPNSSALDSINSQSSKEISYGMLIDADSNIKTGYNGADYDLYVELVAGKLSGYLYQMSSTGGFKLIGSKINFTQSSAESSVGPGYVNLHLDLSSINFPSKYNILFYTAESLKSNEVRQFTSWVNIPPPNLQITTSPNNINIRQGEEQLIPARIKSTSGFSNDVINITSDDINNNNYNARHDFNLSKLLVHVQRNQPPLFKIDASQQTPLGIYTIPLIVTIREPSVATITKPISINTRGGTVDPEFELSKKYPTVGYLTKPINLTITVTSPRSISDQFRDFWGIYGQFIGIFAGAFIGSFAKLLFDRIKKKNENE
jgi:hypothetical protein